MKAKLNKQLLSTLPRVLRMTNDEVSKASGISIAVWYRITRDPERITVQQLIALANGLHVPVRRFFSFGKAETVGVREDYIVQSGYRNCYYDSDAVHRRIGEGTATSWRDAAEAVGMHWTNVSHSLLAVGRTPVTRLLKLCDAFSFDLFGFLVDPNEAVRKAGHPTPPDGTGEGMRGEAAAIRRDLAELAAAVDSLSGRYAALLEAHRELLRRFEEHLTEDSARLEGGG